ncbi:MAG: serine/threonine-protein kinase, partial [Candidatus Acidiferrales bacterium]
MQRIGRYEVLEELGRGAMGAVYKARDPQIGRIVAIKIILTAGRDPEELAQYKLRFYREAQTAGQLSHPGIVTIHDIAEDENGQPYLVMEFVDGITLHRMLRPAHSGHLPERLPLDQALDIGAQVAEALDFAHKRGVIHRDVKPGNILITADGRTKIADFGIAKFADAESTRSSTVIGTPAYMAPELLRGGTVDARSDIFSAGAMLYWILTGQKPFPGEDLTSVSFKVVYTDPPRPTEVVPELPPDLDTVISRCLAKNPAERYPTAKDLAADLQLVRAGTPITTTAAPRTVAADEPTVTTMVDPGRPTPPAVAIVTQSAGASALRRKLRIGLPVAGAAAVVLVALMCFWPEGRRASVPLTTPATAAPGKARSATSGAPPAQNAAAATSPIPDPAGSAPPSTPLFASTALLEVECNFSFRNATLQVFLDG